MPTTFDLSDEARFRTVFENAGSGFLLVDEHGTIEVANSAAAALLGYEGAALRGRAIGQLIDTAQRFMLLRRCRELLAGTRERFTEDTRLVRRDGQAVWVRITATLMRSASGTVAWGFVILQDISEQKRTELALRRSEERYTSIVAIAPDAIISIDETQRIVQFNRAAERLFGYDDVEVLGQPIERLIPERFGEAHREHVRRLGEDMEQPVRMAGRPVTGRRKSGEEFTADVAISSVVIEGEHVYTAVVHDITATLQLQAQQRFLADAGEELSSTLDLTEALHRTARLGARHLAEWCVVDLADGRGTLRRVAAAHHDPARQSLADALLEHPLTSDRAHIAWKALQTRRPALIEHIDEGVLAALARNGEHAALLQQLSPASALAVPLVARGEVLGVMLLVRGRTGRPYQTADLPLAQELGRRAALALDNARLYHAEQQAARARERVLGIVAHDLRSPLNGITLAADMLTHYLGEGTDQSHRRAAQAILREADRMNRLIQDLLDVRAIEAGRLTVEVEPLPARALLEEAASRFRPQAAAREIELRVDAAPDLPWVSVDPVRINQVFANLLDNALKFTPRYGSITLSAQAAEDDVRFSVTDTGPGISAADREHIFAPFWQGFKGDRRGAGLGLSIARGIVEAHGGRMDVASSPGRGSEFWFTLTALAPQRPLFST